MHGEIGGDFVSTESGQILVTTIDGQQQSVHEILEEVAQRKVVLYHAKTPASHDDLVRFSSKCAIVLIAIVHSRFLS